MHLPKENGYSFFHGISIEENENGACSMIDNLGSGVSRVLDPTEDNYDLVVLQQGKPPTDCGFNTLQQIISNRQQNIVLSGAPSGFIGNETNPRADFVTNLQWSNFFRFGTQRTGEFRPMLASVNGWLLNVTSTLTGSPPGSPDNVDSFNNILLPLPPSNAGSFRIDFVYLEVFKVLIAPNPSTANKPSSSGIYAYGNVNSGLSYLPDDLIDPALGFSTELRTQICYSIRVAPGIIGLTTNPDGFDPTIVKAQGAAAAPTAYVFTNMRQVNGDVGCWRAGDGTQNALGTVDGYSYAIPICAVFRRNSVAWSGNPSQNLNGGFSRSSSNSTGIITFSTVPTLTSDLSSTATVATIVSATAIPLPINPASPVLIQIGDELLTYTAITTGTPPQITGLTRGVNGTRSELHRAGTVVAVLSGRPDGLFADQVALTDILDLRHAVNPNGFDYDTLLKGNLDKLLRGQLRANWKRTGAGPQGNFNIYQDAITDGSVSLGVTQLDSFDGIRQIFSDSASTQRVECICLPNSSGLPASVTSGVGFQINISANMVSRNPSRAPDGTFTAGDQIQIPVIQLKAGLSAGDADQVRWLYDGIPGAVTIRLDGQSVPLDPSLYTVTGTTSLGGGVVNVTSNAGTIQVTTATPQNLRTGQTVLVSGVVGVSSANGSFAITTLDNLNFLLNGTTFSGSYSGGGIVNGPSLTSSDDLLITFGPNFPTVNSGATSGPTQIYITLNVLYGPGRGLARRPDSLHSISYINPSTDLMVRPMGVPSSNQQVSVTWLPLWQKYRGNVYKNNVPVQSECFGDLGSKSVVITPFRRIIQAASFTTMDGTIANPYTTTSISGIGFSTSPTVFTDLLQNFTALGIKYGDTLILTGGPSPGRFLITGVTATTLTVATPLPPASFPSLSYKIEHLLALVVGTTGTVVSGSTTLTDTSVNFSVSGVVAGDQLFIYGTYSAKYTVLTVAPTSLTVERPIFMGNGSPTVNNINYTVTHTQGLMPTKASDGVTSKWVTTDPLGLFSGSQQPSAATKNIYVTLPRHLAPGWGAFYVPILWEDATPFAQGISFMSLSVEGAGPFTNSNCNYVPYVLTNGNSFATFSTVFFGPPIVSATYNTVVNGICGMQQFTDTRGLGRQGLQLPPFYGIARLFAVYEANDYNTNHSAYNSSTRAPLGTGSTNLLRQNMNHGDGPTFWVEIDADGDSTFILNANAIDLTRSPNTIANFAAGNYVIEASIFGFDRGSFDITKEFRIVLTNPTTPGSSSGYNRGQAIDPTGRYTTGSGAGPNVGAIISGPTTVLPGPATQSDQVVINYSRTPYQGDAWGSQTNYIDIPRSVGPLQTGVAYQLASTHLQQNNLTRPNQKLFEVLSSVGFATTLGTGRISGDASVNPVSISDVGYEDPLAYPPTSPSAPRPVTLPGTFLLDHPEIGTEYLGATERLPLGALFRDADFRGGLMGSPVASPLVYFDETGVAIPSANLAVKSSLEQTEVLLDTSTQATGAPSDLITHVDGEQNNYSLLVNFRTFRGGSLFTAGGGHPGGEVIVQGQSVQAPDGHTNVLEGRAMLVRNYVTNIGANEVSPGGELMMLVVTNVERLIDPVMHPGFITIGTNGTGEGYAAADIYRIDGHPMVRDNIRLFLDPTTITLSFRST
jgi:hypothetical protein